MNEFKVGDRVAASGEDRFTILDGIVKLVLPPGECPYVVASESRPGAREIYSANEMVRREGGVA